MKGRFAGNTAAAGVSFDSGRTKAENGTRLISKEIYVSNPVSPRLKKPGKAAAQFSLGLNFCSAKLLRRKLSLPTVANSSGKLANSICLVGD
jgi:hypothetical protein